MTNKTLSIFIDESGDFGKYDYHSPFYLITLVLHDQSFDISSNILGLETHLKNMGYPNHAIHTGPLIRRESIYSSDFMENRKKLFDALFNFSRKLNFKYLCITIPKKECSGSNIMTEKLSRILIHTLREHLTFLNQFNQIIIYYDNGQIELSKIFLKI